MDFVYSQDIMSSIISKFYESKEYSNLLQVCKLWHNETNRCIKNLIYLISNYLAKSSFQPNILVPTENKFIHDYKITEYPNKFFEKCQLSELLNWYQYKIKIATKEKNINRYIIPYLGNYYTTNNEDKGITNTLKDTHDDTIYIKKKVIRNRKYYKNAELKFQYVENAIINIPHNISNP